jgi:hypothetical protein
LIRAAGKDGRSAAPALPTLALGPAAPDAIAPCREACCCGPAAAGDGESGERGWLDFESLHAISFDDFMRLNDNTRAMFSKACPNGLRCAMGTRCVRIHGTKEPAQDLALANLAQDQPDLAARYGVIACRDFLLLPDGCPRAARCGYRHLSLSRPLTALQVCALLLSFFMRVARQRSEDVTVNVGTNRGDIIPESYKSLAARAAGKLDA